MSPAVPTWTALIRRFLKEDKGGAGLQYVLFTACWSAGVSSGLYFGAPKMTAKLDAVSAALRAFH